MQTQVFWLQTCCITLFYLMISSNGSIAQRQLNTHSFYQPQYFADEPTLCYFQIVLLPRSWYASIITQCFDSMRYNHTDRKMKVLSVEMQSPVQTQVNRETVLLPNLDYWAYNEEDLIWHLGCFFQNYSGSKRSSHSA